jgi:type II secretory pathway pseudopilin PulG
MRFLKGRKAFTLAELLLAAAILGFSLSALLLLFVNCIILNKTSRNITLAYNSMQAKMEEIRNLGYRCLNPGTCPAGCAACVYDADTFTLTGFASGEGSARIEISDQATNLKLVRIKACFKTGYNRWSDSCNINNSATWVTKLSTFITK